MDRSARREVAFKLLYSLEIQKTEKEEAIEMFTQNNDIAMNEMDKNYVLEIANGIADNKEAIEEAITKNLKKEWSLNRISKIDTALLKLAIYEIQYKKVPFKVVINEVVELAKKYGEDQSPAFINGMLANIIKEIEVNE